MEQSEIKEHVEKLLVTIEENRLYWQPFLLMEHVRAKGIGFADAREIVSEAFAIAYHRDKKTVAESIDKCVELGIVKAL